MYCCDSHSLLFCPIIFGVHRRCLPYLKFVRGTGWERKHWTQLFIMLKLVTKVRSYSDKVNPNLIQPRYVYVYMSSHLGMHGQHQPHPLSQLFTCVHDLQWRLTMQGPDAVTFDNLTLAHFLDKADRLAGCAEEIKALNAQVHPFADIPSSDSILTEQSAVPACAFCNSNRLLRCTTPSIAHKCTSQRCP